MISVVVFALSLRPISTTIAATVVEAGYSNDRTVHLSLRVRSTLCLKEIPTFKLYVTLSNLNRFSKFLHCWKAYVICYKTHAVPWKIKNSNFWPPVNCACVPQLFINTRFVQLFSGNSSVNLFAVYPFKYKILSKSSLRR